MTRIEQKDVGSWVRRDRPGRPWHYIDSAVAGAAITKCGRRLEPESDAGHGLVLGDQLQAESGEHRICRFC